MNADDAQMDTEGEGWRTDHPSDELTREIIGAAYAVANTLGHGFLEAVYRKSLVVELEERGVAVAEEVPYRITYQDRVVGIYAADLVVAGRVIVELKAVDSLTPAHVSQLLNYLKAARLRTGLLLNFGTPRLGIKRVVR